MEKQVFPIITKEIQEAFEREQKEKPDRTPEICGYYGRGCRQKGKEEGANRALCMHCPLAKDNENICKGSTKQ